MRFALGWAGQAEGQSPKRDYVRRERSSLMPRVELGDRPGILREVVSTRRPGTRRDQPVDVRRDASQRREPYAALLRHVLHEIRDSVEARKAAADEGVPHRNPHAAVTPGGIELGAEYVHGMAGRLNRHLVVELAAEHVMAPVIERVVTGHLQERGAAVAQAVGNVIAHQ